MADFIAPLNGIGCALSPKPAFYVIHNTETGSFYAGSTDNIQRRAAKHLRSLNNHTSENHGLRRELETIHDRSALIIEVTYCETGNLACSAEQLFINKNYTNPGCLNVAIIANNGSGKALVEVAGNLENSDKYKEYKKRLSEGLRRFGATDQGQAIKSEMSKANWENPDYRKRMIAARGNKIVIDGVNYNSVREAARAWNVTPMSVRRAIDNDGNVISADLRKGRTKQVSANGIVYPTVNDCAAALGLAPNTVTWRCQNTSDVWKDFFYV